MRTIAIFSVLLSGCWYVDDLAALRGHPHSDAAEPPSEAMDLSMSPRDIAVAPPDLARIPSDLMSLPDLLPPCNDKVKNGGETDTDCGGPVCAARCEAGKACVVNADCSNKLCINNHCSAIPNFSAGRPITVNKMPRHLIAANLNGDNFPDLAIANEGSNNVTVLASSGNRNFTPIGPFGSLSSPIALAAGDLNGDKDVDLAVVSQEKMSVGFYSNDGAGNFQSAGAVATNRAPWGVVLADLNGDGKLDVAVTNRDDNSIYVRLGKGNGDFANVSSIPGISSPRQIVVADMDMDMKLDLIVSTIAAPPYANMGQIAVLKGQGNGTFMAPTLWGASVLPGGPAYFAVADVDIDKKQDLVLASRDSAIGNVRAFTGDGKGTLMPEKLAYNSEGIGARPPILADFTFDGVPDLVVANRDTNSIRFFTGMGDGTLQPGFLINNVATPSAIASADFDGDGKLDFAVASCVENGLVTVYFNISQ